MRHLRILMVEDSADDAELLLRALRRAGYEISYERVETPAAMQAALNQPEWNLVISDYTMPHFNGLDALRLVREQTADLPFILVSGTIGEEVAVQAVKAGANDYVLKDNLARLCSAIERELNDADARKAQRRIESRYENLFNTVPVGVLFVAPDGRVMHANPVLLRILALEGETLGGAAHFAKPQVQLSLAPDAIDFRRFVQPDDRPRFEAFMARAGCATAEDSFDLIAADGTKVSVSISAGLPDAGEAEAICMAVADVTELKRAQELAIASMKELADTRAMMVSDLSRKNADLEVAREAALQASQAKSEFLAHVSHEVRTPVSSIIGLISMLLDTSLTQEQSQLGLEVKENGNSLLNIINDILDFSKMSAGKLVFRDSDFELQKTVKSALEMVRGEARKKGLKTSVSIEPAILPCLRGDPNRLAQVLINLLTNAVKFTERGEVSVSITELEHTADSVELRFEVSDTGIGIADKMQAQLFQPFSQVDRPIGGTGLGLAIARGLVERMAGAIGLRSSLGAGSTFWFTAKFAKAAVESASPLQASSYPLDESAAGKEQAAARILVVEDNAANRKVTLWQLGKLGYTAESALNGSEALKALARSPYDVVLMDCRMPVMDGYEASRRIRQSETAGQHIKIVAMTAHGLSGDQRKCLDAGMDDYICKPVEIEDLAAVLLRHLANKAETPPPAWMDRP